MIDWKISRLSSAPTIAAIMSISLRCCRSMSLGNRRFASGASSKKGCKIDLLVFAGRGHIASNECLMRSTCQHNDAAGRSLHCCSRHRGKGRVERSVPTSSARWRMTSVCMDVTNFRAAQRDVPKSPFSGRLMPSASIPFRPSFMRFIQPRGPTGRRVTTAAQEPRLAARPSTVS
jgi:hypothetical protein